MEFRITIPWTRFEELLAEAVAHPGEPAHCVMDHGTINLSDGDEWLLGLHPPSSGERPEPECLLGMRLSATPLTETDWAVWFSEAAPAASAVLLTVSPDGKISGYARTPDGQVQEVTEIWLPGPGMLKIPVSRPDSGAGPQPGPRWSRLAGALGADPLARLQGLRPALMGASRNGSLIATTLVRMGVHRLTLIDPDRIELHNLDAMDLITQQDVGHHKVMALARRLRQLAPDDALDLHVVPHPVWAPAAISAVKESDFLISCVDDDAARIATGIIAHHLGRPHLDIASGVFHADGGERLLGGDVRLILPGEGCLACVGGVRRIYALDRALAPEPSAPPAWAAQRAGSLRSLNQINVHLGVRLLEELVCQDLRQSTWLRFEWRSGHAPSLTALDTSRDARCAVCRAPTGDAPLTNLRRLVVAARHQIRQRHARTTAHARN